MAGGGKFWSSKVLEFWSGKVDSGAVGQLAVGRKWLLPRDGLKNKTPMR